MGSVPHLAAVVPLTRNSYEAPASPTVVRGPGTESGRCVYVQAASTLLRLDLAFPLTYRRRVDLVRWLILILHALLGALLLGGALYSIMTVQPRAKAFFKDVRDFEGFIANLAHGARWQFLAVMTTLGISGFIYPWFSPHPFLWWLCFAVKCVLWTATLGCFVYVSWYLWPRRIFAATDELPAIHREFAVAARTILGLLFGSFVLGVVMAQLR